MPRWTLKSNYHDIYSTRACFMPHVGTNISSVSDRFRYLSHPLFELCQNQTVEIFALQLKLFIHKSKSFYVVLDQLFPTCGPRPSSGYCRYCWWTNLNKYYNKRLQFSYFVIKCEITTQSL